MGIPKTCGHCIYGHTYDLSIDDLSTHCFVLGYSQNWCDDFLKRQDNTLRMRNCPLPDITDQQLKIAEGRLKERNLKNEIFNRILFGKTKLIRKRNASRLNKMMIADEKYNRQ